MMQEIKPVNQRIRTYRKLAGYTQQTAADALGIKKNTYARMELHGNPTPDMLLKLSDLFNVSIDLICSGVEKAPKEKPIITSPTPKPLARLEEEPDIFVRRPMMTLSVNEKTCILVARQLPKDKQNQIMAFINKLYSETKGNG